MPNANILYEVPPLSPNDSFVVFERINRPSFTFPIHTHTQFELNYIENAAGVQRIVGDHVSEIDDLELVLITGSNLEHTWLHHNCQSQNIYEVTIQFNPDLFEAGLLSKNQFAGISRTLTDAAHGLSFSRDVIMEVQPLVRQITSCSDNDPFESVLLFLRIMHKLSGDSQARILSRQMSSQGGDRYDSRRVKQVMEFMSTHYRSRISLEQMAAMVNMSEASFSRFIKLRTGMSFIDCLNDIRLSAVSRLLIDEPTNSIADIAYRCGFNNVSHFNRIFKKKNGYTPQTFRRLYTPQHIIV